MELEFNEKTYKFVFGLGFLKAINRANQIQANGIKVNAGLEVTLTHLVSGDVETLISTLKTANETETPRISEKILGNYIEENDADDLFDQVIDELKKSAFTKKKVDDFMDQLEARK